MKQMRFSTLADISKNGVYQNKKLSKKEMCGLLSLNTKRRSHKKKNFYGDDFFDIKKSGTIYNMHIYWTKQNPFVIAKLVHHYTKPNDFVLDAFCGSGMTGVAAKIVGRNVILIDLSPSAIHISRNYTTLTDPEPFKDIFTKIYEDVYKELIWMFRTKCHICGNENALVESTILSDVYACPYCSKGVIYGNEQRWSSLKTGAKIKTITCDHCTSKFNIKDAKFLRRTPIEIRVRCNKCKVSGKNKIKKLSKEDMELYKKIEDMRIPYPYPEDVRFFGWEPKRNIKKGIYYPYQMFSKRNLYVLAAFWDKINKIENKKIKEKLQFLFTGALFNVSLMVRWHHKYDVVVTGTRTRKGTLYIPPIINDANPFIPFKVKSNTIYRGLGG
ncbi:MAG TPA: hypothetical protein HA348_04825 [Thermoplasmata archaeon]|nr:hypothetical protein [Thermoplasmata archaeon]